MGDNTRCVRDDDATGVDEPAAISDRELAARAASGDMVSAGEYVARNLTMLSAMSKRIAGSAVDAEDLLSTALTALISRWRSGSGPTEHPNAYVIQTMRNRVKDELKSPRSRVESLDADIPSRESGEIHAADLHWETSVVRKGLGRLPVDQRRVMTACVVDGRKPSDVATELGRSPAAVSMLLVRGRLALRRATLQVVLEDHAPIECVHAARRLPRAVPNDPSDGPGSRAMTHVRACARCRARWSRFTAMSSAFGIGGLLIVGQLSFAPATAQAAVTATGAPASGGDRPRRARSRSRVTSAVVGALIAASGATVMIGGIVASQLAAPSRSAPAGGMVVNAAEAGQQLTLDVSLSFAAARWTVDRLVISGPERTALAAAPYGWSCRAVDTRWECATTAFDPPGGRFVVTGGHPADTQYEVIATGAADGVAFTARWTGTSTNDQSPGPVR